MSPVRPHGLSGPGPDRPRCRVGVFGFRQSALWGWGNPVIWASIAVGVLLLIVFFAVERRADAPLINVRIFADRRSWSRHHPRRGDDRVLPVFLFAALYGRIALAEKATTSSLLILYFFLGFVGLAQIGGRMLDRIGASGRSSSAACWQRSGSACGPARRRTCASAPR